MIIRELGSSVVVEERVAKEVFLNVIFALYWFKTRSEPRDGTECVQISLQEASVR